jgi:4-carboxymuconolactone decarboxylase
MVSPRLPTIPPADYDDTQRATAAAFHAHRGVDPFGPYEALLHSPKLMLLAQSVGEYLRYHSGIGTTLSELVILLVARHWSQDFEWHAHAPIAAQAGIAPDIIAAIRDGRRPDGMTADETLVYDVTTELHQFKRVSDLTWSRAEQRFGKPAMVDLIGISGYYGFLAMQMNACRYAPPGNTRLPRFPD